MATEVIIALVGVTVLVLLLFTVAAFRYVPATLIEEVHEESESLDDHDELRATN